MTYKTTIKPLLLGSAALLFASMASAEGMQIDTRLDEWAIHTSLGEDSHFERVTSAPLIDAFVLFSRRKDQIFGPGSQIDTDLDDSGSHTSLGDLDGDGDLDLVTSAWGSDAFTVFLNSGDGTFGPGSQIDTDLDDGANHTSLGDLDKDGDLDLVTSARDSDAFTVFLNSGDGNFGPGSQIDTELDDFANHTSLGDLDRDGHLDLIASAAISDAFTVFLGKGDGTFGPGSQIDTRLDRFAAHTSLGDLDGDGDLDLITSANGSDAFTVFLNSGDGTFGWGSQITTELDEFANHTSLGDLDGDGDLDLITSAEFSDAFTVFLGRGDGTFDPGSQIDTRLDKGAYHTSLGDLDRDGDLDLITSAEDSDAFTVFLNSGDSGIFGSEIFGTGSQIDTGLDRGAHHTSLGDLDRDGDLDLITSALGSSAFTVFLTD